MKIDSEVIRDHLQNNVAVCDRRYDSALCYLEEKILSESWDLVSSVAQDLKAINLERAIYIDNLTAIKYSEKISEDNTNGWTHPGSGMQLVRDDD